MQRFEIKNRLHCNAGKCKITWIRGIEVKKPPCCISGTNKGVSFEIPKCPNFVCLRRAKKTWFLDVSECFKNWNNVIHFKTPPCYTYRSGTNKGGSYERRFRIFNTPDVGKFEIGRCMSLPTLELPSAFRHCAGTMSITNLEHSFCMEKYLSLTSRCRSSNSTGATRRRGCALKQWFVCCGLGVGVLGSGMRWRHTWPWAKCLGLP